MVQPVTARSSTNNAQQPTQENSALWDKVKKASNIGIFFLQSLDPRYEHPPSTAPSLQQAEETDVEEETALSLPPLEHTNVREETETALAVQDQPNHDRILPLKDRVRTIEEQDLIYQFLAPEMGPIGQSTLPILEFPEFIKGFIDNQLGRAQSAIGSHVKSVAHSHLSNLKETASRKADPIFDFLVQELHLSKDESAFPVQYSRKRGNKLVEKLKLFTAPQTLPRLLDGIYEANGKQVQMTRKQYAEIQALIHAIEDALEQPGEGPILIARDLIVPVYATMSYFRELQLGWIQLIFESIKTYFIPQVQTVLGLNETRSIAETKIEEVYLKEQAIQQMTIREEPPKEVPATTEGKIEKILKQIHDLSILAEKSILVKIIFPHDPDMLPKVLEIARGQHARDPDIDLNTQAFQEALIIKFDEKRGSFFSRLALQFHLNITALIIRFYIQHISSQLRSDLMNFLLKTPDQRLDDIFAFIIDPFKDHLTTFYSELQNLSHSNQVLPKSIEALVDDFFKKFTVDGKTHTSLLNELSAVLVGKYAPTFSWTSSLSKALDDIFPKDNPVFDAIKRILTSTSYIITGPFQWILNFSIRRLIQSVVTRSILPAAFQSIRKALGVGSHYQHFINLFLEKKLNAFNSKISENKRKLMAVRSSLKRQDEMKGVVDQLFQIIPLQQAMNDPAALQQFFDHPHLSLEYIKKMIDKVITSGISPTASLEVLKVLEKSLETDLLSEFVCYAFDSLIKISQEEQQPVSDETKRVTEQRMLFELSKAIRSAVKEAVETALDPSKQLNDQIINEVEDLRNVTLEFVTSCEAVDESSFEQQDQAWIELSGSVTKLMDKWARTKVDPLIEFSKTIGDTFIEATSEFSELMKTVQPLQKHRDKLKKIVEELKIKQSYFNTSHLTTAQINAAAKGLYGLVNDARPKLRSLEEPLTHFLNYTQLYMGLRTVDEEAAHIFTNNFEEIKILLNQVISSLEDEIASDSQKMNTNTDLLKQKLSGIEGWAKELKPVTVTSKDVSSLQLLGKIAGTSLKEGLVKWLMDYVSAILAMKSKPYHWDGVTWRIINAYIQAPPQKPLSPPETPFSSSSM